jgi:hypothetical protein
VNDRSGELSGPAFNTTGHAREQMSLRAVNEQQIRSVLLNYDIRRPAEPRRGAKPAEIYVGKVGGRTLRVYVEIGSSPPLVKTVAWED